MVAAVITERELLEVIVDAATTLGWETMHIRPGRAAGSYRTPVQGTAGVGWPDLVLFRDRLLVRELKVKGATLTVAQRRVLTALQDARVDAGVWTERDWTDGTVWRTLRIRWS